MTDQDHLDRINALTRNARQTWFGLLAALVYVSITLMGVEHIDFYGFDRATDLPIIDLSVPTRYFFLAAPILIAAVYCYFHLYLIRLWDALGSAPSRVHGIRLADAVTPWMITDAALHIRSRSRKDNCAHPRPVDTGASILNLLLAWIFGLIVLMFLWVLSFPPRDFLASLLAAVCLVVAFHVGFASFSQLQFVLGKSQKYNFSMMPSTVSAGLLLFIGALTFLSTKAPLQTLFPVNLSGRTIVERPNGWVSFEDARRDFRSEWCRREDVRDCATVGNRENEFEREFLRRRQFEIENLRKPSWHKPGGGNSKIDLRKANLDSSFLVGVNLQWARLENAEMRWAEMEDVSFLNATLDGASFFSSSLENSSFWFATLDGTSLQRARIYGSNFWYSSLVQTDLIGTDLTKAELYFARLEGRKDDPNYFYETNFDSTVSDGSALRYVSMVDAFFDGRTDFRNAFFDGSVIVSEQFKRQMGNPCQWKVEEITDDALFYGHWRGWIEAAPREFLAPGWSQVAPEGFEDVAAIAPPAGCKWKTGPMPGAAE